MGIVQEIEIWPYEQMLYAQPRICSGEWDEQTLHRFWDTNGSPNLSQTTRLSNNQQEKEKLLFCGFAALAYQWVKFKGNGKKDNTSNLKNFGT